MPLPLSLYTAFLLWFRMSTYIRFRAWSLLSMRYKNLAIWRESKLSAGNTSIPWIPAIITDCSPLVVVAELHSPLPGSQTSHQTKRTTSAVADIHSNCSGVEWIQYLWTVNVCISKLQPLTRTFHSSIIPMITERRYAINSIVCTVKNTSLISSAAHVIQPDWSTCAAIVGIEARDCTLEEQQWSMKPLNVVIH